ncbi:hypothetical protein O181_072060 [Austropuccinia psidii MF-1]|uniref:Uncharacterized protein n=1 Tax=Austropuccinia psidii MF-1 TaxID=1389203 RepID=A0A9Q3IAM7_9BASI|nr:hypothetical protein [Austropuccinia psidii MF-1]
MCERPQLESVEECQQNESNIPEKQKQDRLRCVQFHGAFQSSGQLGAASSATHTHNPTRTPQNRSCGSTICMSGSDMFPDSKDARVAGNKPDLQKFCTNKLDHPREHISIQKA